MASIASTVRHFKRDPDHFLPDDLIRDAVEAAGHRFRDRLLGPVLTVRLMILQVLREEKGTVPFGKKRGQSPLVDSKTSSSKPRS